MVKPNGSKYIKVHPTIGIGSVNDRNRFVGEYLMVQQLRTF